jgi:OFA family oxalate/formate antiporter-like MFS transporter
VATLGRVNQIYFVASMALVFFTWGELYVLFPAVLTDMFGTKNSATNYSILYSTKGLASILAGGLAAQLFESTGTWNYAFIGSAVLALCAALGSILVRSLPLPHKAVATTEPGIGIAVVK